LIKEVSLSLLLAAVKPAFALVPIAADTSRNLSLANGLDTPSLLVADSTKRVFPIYFCGEEVPVHEPRVSRRWLQTLRTYGSQTECLTDMREKASKFFKIIDPVLVKYRIPRDFRFMPLVESALVNHSTSRKGASGYWQLMPGTARELGLTVSGSIDERYDLDKSTVAVCRYLHQLYGELGSWTLVAAAYNGGITHVQNQMSQQRQSNYYKLRLHRETSHYLFRILAYKELLSNPRQYSLLLSESTIAELTKPLPNWNRPLASSKKNDDSPTVELVDVEYTDPTWGPRHNTSLTRLPSDTQQLIAQAASLQKSISMPDGDLDTPSTSLPIQKLMMGLMVLRFRRPRFLKRKKDAGMRPVHIWDWI
jgi:hypothetical protein